MLTTLDAVVFDFDGVLNRNYDAEGFRWSRTIEADFGINVQAFTDALFTEAFRTVIVGGRDLKEALEEVLPTLGYRKPVDEFLAYWFVRDLAPCDDTLAILAEVRAGGMRCVIGTNNEKHRAKFLWENLLKGRVDGLYASGHMGVAKPDVRFFQHIQDDLKVADPSRLLLIDDIPHNIEGAKAAGWQAIPYGDFSRRVLGDPMALRKALGLK